MDKKDKKDEAKKPAIGGGLAKLLEQNQKKLDGVAQRTTSGTSRNITKACNKGIKNSEFLLRLNEHSLKAYGEPLIANARLATYGRENGFLQEIEISGEHEGYIPILTAEEKQVYDISRDAIEQASRARGGTKPGFQAFRDMIFAEMQSALAAAEIEVCFVNPDAVGKTVTTANGRTIPAESLNRNRTSIQFSNHWANDDEEGEDNFLSGSTNQAAKLNKLKAQLDD